MKLRFFATMSIFCATTAMVAAQDYDDIYYDSSQEEETVEVTTPPAAPVEEEIDDEMIADYYTADQTAGWEGSVVDVRDVDEYNRHYAAITSDTASIDTVLADGDTFRYTERIRRFHNPEVIDSCADEEAVDLYVYTRPDVNIIVGTPATTYISPLGATVSVGTWGWGVSVYDPWFDPWYYDPWYYRPYWHYASWYRPYWGWGWCAPYYAYHHHHHYHDWWRPAPPRHYSAGGRRLYANTGRYRGYAAGATRGGGGRMMAAGNRRPATVGGRVNTPVRRQAVTSAGNRRVGSGVATGNSLNRYKARVNRVNASAGNLASNRVGAVTTGNRVNNVRTTGNRVNAVISNRINRTPSVSSATRRPTTSVRRTNQLNRRPAASTSTLGTERTGYRPTSRGTSYYRSPNRSTSTYRGTAPSYSRSRNTSTYRSTNRSTSTYNRSGSSYRGTTRSSGYSRGSGAMRGGGGGGRGRR